MLSQNKILKYIRFKELSSRVFLIFIAGMLITGCDMFGNLSWKKYENKQYRFSISFPRSWQIEENSTNPVIVVKAPVDDLTDIFQENINVMVSEFPNRIDKTVFLDSNKEELHKIFPNMYNVSEDKKYIGGKISDWFSFDVKQTDSLTLRVITVAIEKKNSVYVISFACELDKAEKYEPIFNGIINTFQIY